MSEAEFNRLCSCISLILVGALAVLLVQEVVTDA